MAQLSMFARPQPRERDVVFFALMLGPQLAAAMPGLAARLRREFGVRAPVFGPRRLHMSLLGVGFADALDPEEVETARAAARDFAVAPFELAFGQMVSFGRGQGPRAVVLRPTEGGAAACALSCGLAEAMIARGLDPRGRPLAVPHLTLLYDRAPVPETALEPPVRTRIERAALIYSHRGQGRYTLLAETA